MLLAVVPTDGEGGSVRPVADDGRPAGPARVVDDLAAAVRAEGPEVRVLWASAAEAYPRLRRAGARVDRCHDLELTEALLLGHAGRWGEPRSVAAIWARLTGAPVPPDPPVRAATPPGDLQGALFETGPPPPATPGFDPMRALLDGYRDQLARIAALPEPRRFRLLVAAESAGGLVAVEMGQDGLPWRADVHEALLLDLLGEPSPVGGPPRKLAELSARIADAFGGYRIHPESPAEVLRAFAREGLTLPSTRAWVLRGVDHPAVPLLLEYKELYRIWTAHGWSWLHQWVLDGRFRPEYVAGGVVSGRWATRGGGALQIPKVVRRAVTADPGWALVVADAGQLEPRILAAVSGDQRMMRAAGTGDMYAALATESFAGDRAKAKVALLAAMYGSTSGRSAPALATLRHTYPTAFAYVEEAARTGEAGGLVRSWLGRTCPPPSVTYPPVEAPQWPPSEGGRGRLSLAGSPWGAFAGGEEGERLGEAVDAGRPGSAARARGRFTRNFVIQATASEWALSLLALVRAALRELAGDGRPQPPPDPGHRGAWTGGDAGQAGRLVFFQHDEIVVHCPAADAPAVAAAITEAGERVRRLLFGDTPVRFPLGVSIVDCYADAK